MRCAEFLSCVGSKSTCHVKVCVEVKWARVLITNQIFATMPKGKRLFSLVKNNLDHFYNYFDALEKLYRYDTLFAVLYKGRRRPRVSAGLWILLNFIKWQASFTHLRSNAVYSKATIKRVMMERCHGGSEFSSPAKRYKVARRRVVVDDFDWEAIQRCIYQLYDAKEHVTFANLLVRKFALPLVTTQSWSNFRNRELYESDEFLWESGHRCTNWWAKWDFVL